MKSIGVACERLSHDRDPGSSSPVGSAAFEIKVVRSQVAPRAKPTITIPVSSEWATSKELARRNKVEAALNGSGVMQSIGAGAGLGKMDLSFRVDDAFRVSIARAKIDAAMALLMPDFEYEVTVQSDPVRALQVKVGDVFAIRLAESRYAMGVGRFVLQRMRRLTACMILDALVPEPRFVVPVSAAVALDPIFVYNHSLADGSWPILGNTEVESAPLMHFSSCSFHG